MSEKVTIIGGVVIFLALMTFPIWYTKVAGEDTSPPDLELPQDGSRCIEDNEEMIQNHMAMIEQFPHRVQKGFQREFDFPFDPES